MFTLQRKSHSRKSKEGEPDNTGEQPAEKPTEKRRSSKALDATPGATRSRAGDNATDALFAGLADNRLME